MVSQVGQDRVQIVYRHSIAPGVFVDGVGYDRLVDAYPQDDPGETEGHEDAGHCALVLLVGDSLQARQHLGDDQPEAEAHAEQRDAYSGHASGQEESAYKRDGDQDGPGQDQGAYPVFVDQLHSQEGCDHSACEEAQQHPARRIQGHPV